MMKVTLSTAFYFAAGIIICALMAMMVEEASNNVEQTLVMEGRAS